MANTKNLATVPSVDSSNSANLLAEVNGEIVRLPYSLIDEKLVLKTEFSEYKISNDAELAKQKSDLNNLSAEDVGATPIQTITCAYGNTDEEIIRGLSENWSKLPNGNGTICFTNGADIWYGTYYKYTDTYGSILMQNASGVYTKKFIKSENKLIDLFDETGGTLSGTDLYLGNGLGRLAIDGTGTQFDAFDTAKDTTNHRILKVYSPKNKELNQAIMFTNLVNGGGNSYPLYGEHNKPRGTYTGNGDATERNITIGGLNEQNPLLYIYSSHSGASALVSRNNIFLWSDAKSYMLSNEAGYFYNGNFKLRTADTWLNGNGYTYYWRVL